MTRTIAALALALVGCSAAYKPGDDEMRHELRRVADGFKEQAQRAVGEANIRAEILKETRETGEATDRLATAVEKLVQVLAASGLVRVVPAVPEVPAVPAVPSTVVPIYPRGAVH